MFQKILELVIYCLAGIVTMMVGYVAIDQMIPCDFPKEIKEGNKSIGWVSAGIYIGLGIIIRTAIQTLAFDREASRVIDGLIDTVFYALVGIVFFLIGYYLVDLVNRKYNFNEELKAKNEAAGIMIFGIFVAIGLIISGVIQ